jgi:hypothetical protein
MKCPNCQKGNIRVLTSLIDASNHHSLICDKCLICFRMQQGPPFENHVLPPEYPMDIDQELTAAMNGEPEQVALELQAYPLLEDFKAQLTQ